MTLLEFAEKTSTVPLTAWQVTYLIMYEQAVNDGIKLICYPGRINGKVATRDIIDKYYSNQPTEVFCRGTKKIGIPCNRYLGKVEGKAELLCPICKSINVVENGKTTIKIKDKTEEKL